MTIGNAWVSHHNVFRQIVRTDQVLVALNTLLLLIVGFIPFPTSLISKYTDDGPGRAVMLVYGATFTTLAVLYALLWWYAAHDRRLIARESPRATLDAIGRRFIFTVPLYLSAALLSLLLNGFDPAPILLLAIFYPLSFPIRIRGRTPQLMR